MAHIDDPQTQRANMSYIRKSMNVPLLGREEEQDLARRWRYDQDEEALHKLVRAYARLVVSTASKFRNYGLPMGDLVQEGNVGLMQAAARFEPERDVRFSTYASWWIRSAMQDYVLRNWSIVRTGTTAAQKSLFFNLRRLRARISDAPSGRMTQEGREFVSQELNVGISDVESMELRMSASDKSLNATIADGSDDNWQDFLADTRPDPEVSVTGAHDAKTRSTWLAEAIEELSDREQVIIKERRMVEDGATLEQLGRRLGVSKERVRQLESRALGKLKASILDRVEDPKDLLIEM
ncbi:RNA polymerase factor sigma-32 [Hwanghaeella grinnelliae]|uniref:RNA polymerase sigma factor n=1 Tax=Hwanghaeella grinnelliae TaxID=2500179 RepID=A0A3S2VNA1_9PROT|nr:RNA polymerase factor sigma-32 [Hwanghaeella grinnelliae]RVU36942.1 RNA polymerase factor sigma-32 [Hwanghaeella grinnelliae]